MMLWVMGVQLVSEPLLTQRFGIDGSAAAIVGAHGVGMLWGLGTLLRGRATVRIDLHALRLDLPMMGRIVRIALPSVVQRGAPNLATSLLIRLISSYGSGILAAWVVCGRTLGIIQIPGMGISGAASGMVGLNLGASQVQRAEKAVQTIGRLAVGISAALALVLVAFAPWILGWFNLDADSLAPGVVMLRWLCLGYLLQTVTLVYDAAQVGAGDTVSPMLVNLAALWIVQLPLAWILSRVIGLGPQSIWASLVLGWGVQAVLMVWRFRAARWKTMHL
jgi:Na+-driven multidrug efflux pump